MLFGRRDRGPRTLVLRSALNLDLGDSGRLICQHRRSSLGPVTLAVFVELTTQVLSRVPKPLKVEGSSWLLLIPEVVIHLDPLGQIPHTDILDELFLSLVLVQLQRPVNRHLRVRIHLRDS